MRQIYKEALRFLRQEKKWWIIPIVVAFLVLAALVYFTRGPDPLSPFMYPSK